jgi:hypothetical protein
MMATDGSISGLKHSIHAIFLLKEVVAISIAFVTLQAKITDVQDPTRL